MIKRYKDFLNESIYIVSEIDTLLDKSPEEWDESDIAILKSYATDDEEIKDILKTIKSYTNKFKELNKKLSLASNKGYNKPPKELMDKWVELSRKLSTYENILKNKFKVVDLDKLEKIKKLEEGLLDKMTPKSEEEVNKALSEWDTDSKLDFIQTYIDDDKIFDFLMEGGAKKEDILKYILDEATEKQLKEIIIDMIAYDDEYDIYTVLNNIIGGYNEREEKEIILRAYKKFISNTGVDELNEILNNILLQNPEMLKYSRYYI
jgi:hypothetical protein